MRIRSTFSQVYVVVSLVDRANLAMHLPAGLSVEEHDGRGIVATSVVVQKALRPARFPKRFGLSAALVEHIAFIERPDEAAGVRHGFVLLDMASPSVLFRIGSRFSPYRVRRASCSIEDMAGGIEVAGAISMQLTRTTELPLNWDATANLRRARLHNFVLPTRASGPLRVYRGVLKNWTPEPLLIRSFDAFAAGGAIDKLEPVTAFEVSNIDYQWGRLR